MGHNLIHGGTQDLTFLQCQQKRDSLCPNSDIFSWKEIYQNVWFSSVNKKQSRYSDCEILAFCHAVSKCEFWIKGMEDKLIIHSDHQPLETMPQKNLSEIPNEMLQRMAEKSSRSDSHSSTWLEGKTRWQTFYLENPAKKMDRRGPKRLPLVSKNQQNQFQYHKLQQKSEYIRQKRLDVFTDSIERTAGDVFYWVVPRA